LAANREKERRNSGINQVRKTFGNKTEKMFSNVFEKNNNKHCLNKYDHKNG
jgi:hypothetical protein